MDIKKFVKEKLFKYQDLKYRDFHSNLCPGTSNIIGVRVPVVRNFAKGLLKAYSFDELYENIDTCYYEEILLKGFLIGYCKEDVSVKIDYIKRFVPLINNWAICDSFCSSLKFVKNNMEDIRSLIYYYLGSDKEFEIRFAIVMILDYYITDDYLEDDFKIFDSISNSCYYVEMAIAWAVSICLIKFKEKTYQFLLKNNLDKFTFNKTISKICDSYRVNKDEKEILKKLRK